MNRNQELTNMLGVTYPIIQAPMLGVTTPAMVAAIANGGGLGSLPVGGLSAQKTRELIGQTKALTDKPFAVNLFINDSPAPDEAEVAAMQHLLAQICARHGIPYEPVPLASLQSYSYKEQVPVLLAEGIPVVSFTFGIPDDGSIRAFKENGIVLSGTATCVREALMLADKQVDTIVAQGIEAGGHRGTFINDEPLPQIGVMTLVPQIVNKVRVPVIAAGGINNGCTIRSAMALGAVGVQIGTAFAACNESKAIASYKEALHSATDTASVLTRAFSGRWARGIKNNFMQCMEDAHISIPPYPIQNILTTGLRAAAQQLNNKDFTNLWAGQSAAGAELKPAAEILKRLLSACEGLF